MLKTLGSTEPNTQPNEGRVGVGSSSPRRERSKLDGSELHGGKVDGGEVEDDEVGEKVQKSLNLRVHQSPRICLSSFWTFLPSELN